MKTIVVRDETHEKLRKLGEKGETFDLIINRLIEESEEGKNHD
jgi:predicted CopG family antitoxin